MTKQHEIDKCDTLKKEIDKIQRLTPRQKAFAENCLLIHTYRTHTDAYLAVYKSKGSRKTATANASRIYNMPSVRAYRKVLYRIEAQRAVDRQEKEHQSFLARLASRY